MYIVATFEYSNYLELAITAIQMKGIAKENILCVPMEKRRGAKNLFDTLHSTDGLSLLDLPIILGTIFCLLGGIYGFILNWGPVMWGLICFFPAFAAGLIIKIITTKNYNNRFKYLKAAEVVIIIDCNNHRLDWVQETLWEHNALSVGKLSLE